MVGKKSSSQPGENYLLPSFRPWSPSKPENVTQFLTQKIGQVPRRARGGPTRWASLGSEGVICQGRGGRARQERADRVKTNILLYSCLILGRSTIVSISIWAMVKMMWILILSLTGLKPLFLTLCVTWTAITFKAVSHFSLSFLKWHSSLVLITTSKQAMAV